MTDLRFHVPELKLTYKVRVICTSNYGRKKK